MVTQVMLDQYSPVMVVVDDFFKHATTIRSELESANERLEQVCQKEVRK
jgi:hypothetical protein